MIPGYLLIEQYPPFIETKEDLRRFGRNICKEKKTEDGNDHSTHPVTNFIFIFVNIKRGRNIFLFTHNTCQHFHRLLFILHAKITILIEKRGGKPLDFFLIFK